MKRESIQLQITVSIQYDTEEARAEILDDLVGPNAPYVQIVGFGPHGHYSYCTIGKPTILKKRNRK